MNLIDKAYATLTVPTLNAQTGGTGTNVYGILSTVITWITGIAAGIAVIYLIYSGVLYLTAGGNADATKKAQQGILNAIIGLIIIGLAQLIVSAAVNLIN